MSLDDLLRTVLFLPVAASGMADSIDGLHFFVISVSIVGCAAVLIVAVVFLFRYSRTGPPSVTPSVKVSRWTEAAFIGLLLCLFIWWWVIGFRQYVRAATPPPGAEEVYVTGKQWMWKFSYPNGRATAGILVLPVGRETRLVLTSRDVIHSFYVPAFRVKQDALPGRYTSAWLRPRFEGSFQVYCAEYCGAGHSRMWAQVVALSEKAYRTWLEGGVPPTLARASRRAARQGIGALLEEEPSVSMAEQGRRAAARNGCFACHTIDGQPHIGPTFLGLYGRRVPLSTGERVVADEEYLTRSMMDPLVQVVAGYRPVMPTYQGSLPQPDAGAIVEFIKRLERVEQEPAVKLPEVDVNPRPSEEKGLP